MPYGRRKFSRSDERAYTRSNAVTAIRVPPSPLVGVRVAALADALATEDRRRIESASQQLLDLFCQLLRVPPLRVEVCGKRPTNHYGELHGLYTPANGKATRDRVQVWMRTARRLQTGGLRRNHEYGQNDRRVTPYASGKNALSRVSVAASTADFGISGISHFTFPARISSCAIRHGLRDMVSITGGAPPCSCLARRAATRM